MAEDTTVKLGGVDVRLAVPTSYTQRTEVWLAAQDNHVRGSAAALAMCWRGPKRPRTSYSQSSFNPLIFGQKVHDELRGRGIPLVELMQAQSAALLLITTGLVTDVEVTEAEGNSGAGAEVSAS